MKTYVLIPKSDIERLEEARKKLFEKLFEIIPESFHHMLTFNVTDIIYHITHKKYSEIEGEL